MLFWQTFLLEAHLLDSSFNRSKSLMQPVGTHRNIRKVEMMKLPVEKKKKKTYCCNVYMLFHGFET